jgi:hypothetical protein
MSPGRERRPSLRDGRKGGKLARSREGLDRTRNALQAAFLRRALRARQQDRTS